MRLAYFVALLCRVLEVKTVDNEIINRLLLRHSPEVIAEQYMQLLTSQVVSLHHSAL